MKRKLWFVIDVNQRRGYYIATPFKALAHVIAKLKGRNFDYETGERLARQVH